MNLFIRSLVILGFLCFQEPILAQQDAPKTGENAKKETEAPKKSTAAESADARLPMNFSPTKNKGYEIKIKVEGYALDTAMLGYHFGDKQYIKDTAIVGKDGFFVFKGKEELNGGVYLFVMKPDNKYFEFLVNPSEQQFTLTTKAAEPVSFMKVKGSPDNQLFFEYMNFLGDLRPQADSIRKVMEASKEVAAKKKQEDILNGLNDKVKQYQQNLLVKHPKTLTALLVRANMELPEPKIAENDPEKDFKRWQFYKWHWFDNYQMDDPRILRTPVLFKQIDHLIQKMTTPHPDSIARSVDMVLQKFPRKSEAFKFYLIHYLNEYAQSKIMGMDAVYVHLADQYYAKNQAPWTEDDQIKKIVENANDLKPTLIGKQAPEVVGVTENNVNFKLSQLNTPYVILAFWQPDCGHCQKTMPDLVAFYDKYKDKGVEVVAVCTKQGDEIPKCWKFIKENKMVLLTNIVDTYARYYKPYNIKSTPQIFVLDQQRKIVAKRIEPNQLGSVMDQLFKMEEEKSKEKKPSN